MTTQYSLIEPSADTYDRLYCIQYFDKQGDVFNKHAFPITCCGKPVVVTQKVSGTWVAKTMDKNWLDSTIEACECNCLGQKKWIYVAEKD